MGCVSTGRDTGRTGRGISLQWLVALAIVLAMLLLGAALAWQGYRGIRQTLVAAAGDTAQQVGKTIDERARRLIDPVQSSIRLLAHNPAAHTQAQRLDSLPQLVETLNANRMLSAAYMGYPSGDFLLVRRLRDPQLLQRFAAPPGTAFLVQRVSRGEGGVVQGEWRYYDQALNLLRAQAKPEYRYDPRTRPWFAEASAQPATVLTPPYVFFTTREIGVTLAQRSVDGETVIGMDVSVNDLASETQGLRITPGTEIAVLDDQGNVVAYPDLQRVIVHEGQGVRLSRLSELDIASLQHLYADLPSGTQAQPYQVDGQTWYGMRIPLTSLAGQDLQVLIAVPGHELLAGARKVLFEQLLWTLALMAVLLVLGGVLGRRIVRPLKVLAEQVQGLASFDFSREVGVKSQVSEVRELSQVLSRMAGTIRGFQAITLTLSRERDLARMLDGVLAHLVHAAGVEAGVVYLFDAEHTLLRLAAACRGEQYPGELAVDEGARCTLAAAVTQALGLDERSQAVVLKDRSQALLGILVLQLDEAQARDQLGEPFRQFVEELSGVAAVAIETRQLAEAQQRLMDAMIKLLADAIDAKSPYTGGHCERVPQLAQMLLDQVVNADSGPYASFSMTEAERYEFRVAAWLHDCGKVTSPEYVVDKPTKLETLYNRIHEVRMRFEVLWRDAELAYWRGLASGADPQVLQAALVHSQAQLQDDFAFVAQANIGGESMQDADIERLQQISQQRWQRHFDNRLGISRDEAQRYTDVPQPALPVEELLLADRPEHRVPWGERKPPVTKGDPCNRWGFDMRLPAHASNHGELYNLSIRRGTLNDEERFKINEHIVQTIIMLSSLPFPRQMRRVPAIAGNHHEKLDGSGYPRRLGEHDLGIAERVMAIADIFEALTAADRPYKPPKTLSESVKILVFMARDRHIDGQLLELFLSTGVYRQYAELFLRAEQIDEVDVPYWLAQMRCPA
ncbi:HAMP domain-containing protein [Pseudomonas monteilii]|jgi:HD-GYP domain-containing protein (c-di-GMP phosphodiesterase class II)|uniref:HD domain-containing phosphohydrolase n=1 Tax=Pseudomonas TaxID=286 RepID=UPI000484712F|nr:MULTISPECIES: HD domain-containing phosphohydrolase [Pseudomonas]MBB3272530.1 HD-GYP domain-containing protein (c-di-GMP phosphodiesterase class II)/HAMP domain-containing protein [Pseudomonas sp. OG7]MBH3454214.1 HAMP domain-containing protein [Pseudomonas monteilii]MCJ7850627.1 HAMP domain-containing protein [Pseudomonas monteilii]NBB04117.1 phosphohydrolase [Pseudomonas monteilii]PXX60508.1 HAMP domain-containing protein [Pseudomonas sp. LAIL14HWK12:I1]